MSYSSQPIQRYTGIWQTGNPHQREWIDEIFGPVLAGHVIDGHHEIAADNCILFEAFVYCFDIHYYRQFRGKNAFLVHFLDENFEGRYQEVYENFRGVFRDFWADVFHPKYVMKCPLGYSNGMGRAGRPIEPASRRKYIWSFAGQLGKSSRPDMARALLSIHPHFLAASDDVSGLRFLKGEDREPKRLTPARFSTLLFESAFAPCPMGNIQAECYRPYEALEAGSIPIVEKRLTMDYYRGLLGDHPMPAFRSWGEARHFIDRMRRQPAEMDALQQRCIAWWEDYKQKYRQQVVEFIGRRSADPEPVKDSVTTWRYSVPGWRFVELLRHHSANALARRVQKQVSRFVRDGKLRVAYRPGAK